MKEGWVYKKLGEVAIIIGGSTPKTNINEYWGGDNMWVTPAELNGSKYIRTTQRRITDLAVKKSNLALLPAGTVLLSSRAPIGKVCITQTPMYCNQGFKNIVCKENLYNEFVYYYLINNTDYLQSIGTGATFKEISKKVVENIVIPVPPLSEQERIVSELDLLSSIIEKKKAQLKEYDQLAQSIFYDMFGDPVANEKGFPLQSINDVIKFEGGSQPPKTAFEYTPSSDNIRLIQIRDYKTDEYITYIPKSLARRFCDEDDIMIGRYGPPIFQVLKGIQGAYNVALMKAIPLKGNKEFVRAYLKQECLLHYLENFSRRVAGQDGIQMDKLKSYPFPYPPIELQNLFAEKIEVIEKQKEMIKQSIEETETLFNSRMDYYFN